MEVPTENASVLIDRTLHEAAGGVLYAVCELGVQGSRGLISGLSLQVQISHDGGSNWAKLPLRVCPAHWHRARASDWPPPKALSSAIVDGGLTIEYDSVYDPWEKAPLTALLAHARWQARYHTRWRWWTLTQLRRLGPDERVTR
jgi:hypothetical protein